MPKRRHNNVKRIAKRKLQPLITLFWHLYELAFGPRHPHYRSGPSW